jgi:hypothetical protein
VETKVLAEKVSFVPSGLLRVSPWREPSRFPRHSFEPEGDKTRYDRILVAVDHSEMSDQAVIAARDLATLSKGEVRVLHLREREIATRASP